jgi:hypothetical protein
LALHGVLDLLACQKYARVLRFTSTEACAAANQPTIAADNIGIKDADRCGA